MKQSIRQTIVIGDHIVAVNIHPQPKREPFVFVKVDNHPWVQHLPGKTTMEPKA